MYSGFVIRYNKAVQPANDADCKSFDTLCNTMPERKAYTFKATPAMQTAMSELMERWQIDRTSVIKLALFLLSAKLQGDGMKKLNRHELVQALEEMAPPDFPGYDEFCN